MSEDRNKLFIIKLTHIVIFLFMSACVVYILYAGITRTYDWYLLAAISLVLIEGMVLIINRWQCPLTELARKYGDTRGSVTDMFYPKWFVPHVFRFSTALFVIGLLVLGINYLLK